MKAYERRAAAAYPFFKVDTYDARFGMWRPNRVTFASEAEARAWTAKEAGRYRLVRNDGTGPKELDPFTVDAPSV